MDLEFYQALKNKDDLSSLFNIEEQRKEEASEANPTKSNGSEEEAAKLKEYQIQKFTSAYREIIDQLEKEKEEKIISTIQKDKNISALRKKLKKIRN